MALVGKFRQYRDRCASSLRLVARVVATRRLEFGAADPRYTRPECVYFSLQHGGDTTGFTDYRGCDVSPTLSATSWGTATSPPSRSSVGSRPDLRSRHASWRVLCPLRTTGPSPSDVIVAGWRPIPAVLADRTADRPRCRGRDWCHTPVQVAEWSFRQNTDLRPVHNPVLACSSRTCDPHQVAGSLSAAPCWCMVPHDAFNASSSSATP